LEKLRLVLGVMIYLLLYSTNAEGL